MKFLIQLLCRHLWEDVEVSFLKDKKEKFGFHPPVYKYVKYYSVIQECKCCGKKKTIVKVAQLI